MLRRELDTLRKSIPISWLLIYIYTPPAEQHRCLASISMTVGALKLIPDVNLHAPSKDLNKPSGGFKSPNQLIVFQIQWPGISQTDIP